MNIQSEMINRCKAHFYKCFFILCFIPLFLNLLLPNNSAKAVTVNDVINPRQQYGGWVTDMANMLSPGVEKQINRMIDNLEQENGTEVAVVTVPNIYPSTNPKSFATKLFNTWHIGKKYEDNGLLFLVSLEDRRVEIETGYNTQLILSDAEVGYILKNKIIPSFTINDFQQGIMIGLKALIDGLETNYAYTQAHTGEKYLIKSNMQIHTFQEQTLAGITILIVVMGGILAILFASPNDGNGSSDNNGFMGDGSGDFGGGSSGGGGDGASW